MAGVEPQIEADESVVLARLAGRRDKLTGRPQELRVVRTNWNGRIYVHLRLWYPACKPTRLDDGFRPTKVGVSVREDELDQVIAALVETARLVHSEGRDTQPDYSDRSPDFRPDRVRREYPIDPRTNDLTDEG